MLRFTPLNRPNCRKRAGRYPWSTIRSAWLFNDLREPNPSLLNPADFKPFGVRFGVRGVRSRLIINGAGEGNRTFAASTTAFIFYLDLWITNTSRNVS
jgi:hypothetical protein